MPTDPPRTAGTGSGTAAPVAPAGTAARLWHRELPHYPDPVHRYAYLAIVVVTTVVLYYELYVQYAVATSIITHYHMSYGYFVWVSVIGNLVGAFTSLVAGLADRWGRANLVVYGLLAAGLLLVLALPNAPDKTSYLLLFTAVAIVEGIVLVATPALIRDFSPQLGRATAMGYWTMGPVLGSLVVTVVTSATLDGATWQDELRYSGIAGLVVFVAAFLWLRELSPALRGQVMVSLHDRTLVEARARQDGGGTAPAPAREPAAGGLWRQVLHLDVVGSAVAISLYLLLYFAAVGNFVVYFSANFGYSQQRTNALCNWYWGANAVALVVVGLLSDRARVRKPFMLAGALGSIAATSAFAVLATHRETGYYTFAWLFVAIGVLSGVAYAPWMASFTETVEKRNPAATATGLAVWGWTIRVVVAASSALVPVVVSSASPLVEHGEQVAEAQREAGPALKVVAAHRALFAELDRYGAGRVPRELADRAAREVGPAGLALVRKAQPELAVLEEYGPRVRQAAEEGPRQWRTWWWVTVGGQVVFVPFVFVMAGRWSPRRAREDALAHQRSVESQVRALAAGAG